MPLLILRLAMWALATVCCLSVAFTVNNTAECLSGRFTPFGFLSIAIMLAAFGYAVFQLRRR